MATQVTLGSGVVDSASGLKLRTNGSTEAVDISTGQVVTLAKDALVQGLTVGRGAGAVSSNTAVGASALAANTTGLANTAIGYQAGNAVTSAGEVSLFGYNAGKALTTGYGDAFGSQALSTSTTGTNNSAFGYYTLKNTTTGSYNTAVGFYALTSNTTASNNTAVGYQAGYSGITGFSNAYFGVNAGYSNVSSSGNTFLGVGAGYYITGGRNTIVGQYSGNQGGLDIRTASNYIVLSDGEGNPRLYFNGSGVMLATGVYGNTTASGANLVVAGDGAFQRSTSALKYKQDVRDVEDFDISALRPVRYKSKCEGDDQAKDHLGLIADEAAEAGFEELITRGLDGEVEGFQYERLTVVLLKKLQVLEAEVKALKGQA